MHHYCIWLEWLPLWSVLCLYQRFLFNCTCRSPGFNLPLWPQKSSWAMVPSKTYVTCQKTNIKTVKTGTFAIFESNLSSFYKVLHSKKSHFIVVTLLHVWIESSSACALKTSVVKLDRKGREVQSSKVNICLTGKISGPWSELPVLCLYSCVISKHARWKACWDCTLVLSGHMGRLKLPLPNQIYFCVDCLISEDTLVSPLQYLPLVW